MSARRILVIDDSMMIRRTIKDMLPSDKFHIIEAKDGLQGIELIRNGNPNIIILDFFLPKMSGWEVYQEIQKDSNYRKIPLLLMSGRKEEVMEKITEPLESFCFLEKPFDQKQLVQAIRDAMERSKKLAAYMQKSIPDEEDFALANNSAMAVEFEKLKEQVVHMESEIAHLKKQLNQVITFIKQKLK